MTKRNFLSIANYSKLNVEIFYFSLSQSKESGLLQLNNPLPAESLNPNYSWIQNKEPDDHAYLIAEQVLKYAGNNNAKVLFLSKYDRKSHSRLFTSTSPESMSLTLSYKAFMLAKLSS